MKSNITVVTMLCALALATACPPPPAENLCGRRTTKGGPVIEGSESACPQGFTCTWEDAPSSSEDAEWGVCRRNPTTDAMVLTDASADGGVVDGSRDAAIADLRGSDLVATDTSATDVRVPDAVGSDTLVFDAAQADATVNPCADAGCAANTTCTDMHDGGFECRCGSSGVCSGDAGCRTDESADGGAQAQCCATGYLNCGSSCINPLDDNAHCGSCGNTCTGRGEGNLCVQGSCGCDTSADAGGVCPVGVSAHPAAVSCESVDGGSLGRCEYSCPGTWMHCVGTDPKECETDTQTSTDHCGACNDGARVTTSVNGSTVVLSNRCVLGQKHCGSFGRACTGATDGDECYEAGGAGDTSATCEACWTPEAPLCGSQMCCHGLCIDETGPLKAENCGCDPRPDVNSGMDCTAYTLATAASGFNGKVCIKAGGGLVDRLSLVAGVCGCTEDGETQCGLENYTNDNQTPGIPLAGLCVSNACAAQSKMQCGLEAGVMTYVGLSVNGGTCDPSHGGPLCEDRDSNRMGRCGCGAATSGNDLLCQEKVMANSRDHLVANSCSGTGQCRCDWDDSITAGSAVACDPTGNNGGPDCCVNKTGGCTDLETDPHNCGVCGASCGSAATQACGTSALAAGQCSCTTAPEQACPANGGGGGPDCNAGNKCVCADNGNAPCLVGTYCCAGDFTSGVSVGCCTSPCASTTNTCQRPAGCSGNSTSKTCTTGGQYWCCGATQRCGAAKDECL